MDIAPVPLSAGEAESRSCPRCGERFAAASGLPSFLLARNVLRRCSRCGARWAFGTDDAPRLVRQCGSCGLPFVVAGPVRADRPRCPACRQTTVASPTDDTIVAAAEVEVRHALAAQLRCVAGPATSRYLDGVVRLVARHLPGAPAGARVALVDDSSLETLALPSGLLLISLGLVRSLEDEAELAFVLGHELAHVAVGDAARRLVGYGLRSVVHEQGGAATESWLHAALDLVQLGHGTERELAADRLALEASTAAGYDERSALRFLDGIGRRTAAGDPEIEQYALAHPPAAARREAARSFVASRAAGTAAKRVNREVFRRAAGAAALSGLAPVEGFGTGVVADAAPHAWWPTLLWWGAGALVVMVLLVVLLGT